MTDKTERKYLKSREQDSRDIERRKNDQANRACEIIRTIMPGKIKWIFK